MLTIAAETARDWQRLPGAGAERPLLVAGACGRTPQAVAEARLARGLGYDAVLLSLAAMKGASDDELLAHCEAVAREMPLIGFYLQPAVGGLELGVPFWTRFAALDNVVAIKVAPFNRYRTIDVVRGLVAARAEERVALYTGNDDHIVLDLVTPFVAMRDGAPVTVRFRGGLLGHWSVWTKGAVELLERCKAAVRAPRGRAARSTSSCSRSTAASPTATAPSSTSPTTSPAASPAATRCCAGRACSSASTASIPAEGLGPGQRAAIDRVLREHADLADDAFVAANLERWLA